MLSAIKNKIDHWKNVRRYNEKDRRPIKHTTHGSYAEVKQIQACDHQWVHDKVKFWGYMWADWRCEKCKTMRK